MMQLTDEEQRILDDTKSAVMVAARHLTPTQMAYVMNGIIPGVDFRGCTKGSQAEALAKYWCCGSRFGISNGRRPTAVQDLSARLWKFRCKLNHKCQARPIAIDRVVLKQRVSFYEKERGRFEDMLAKRPKAIGYNNEIMRFNHAIRDLHRVMEQISEQHGEVSTEGR